MLIYEAGCQNITECIKMSTLIENASIIKEEECLTDYLLVITSDLMIKFY